MNTKRWCGPLFRFLLVNGILTVTVTALIFAAMFMTLGIEGVRWPVVLPVFILVLAMTTAYFIIIYRQGRRLRLEQERLTHVFEHLTDGVVILDAALNVVESNPAAKRLLVLDEGVPPVNFCGICSNYPGVVKMCVYDQCFLCEKEGRPVEVTVKQPRGAAGSVTITTSSYRDEDNRIWYILRVAEVETERRNERERISKMITHSMMQAQENERKRISRELHDGIGQSLYGALIQLDVAASLVEEDGPAADRIGHLQNSIRQTIGDIRHLSAELRPSVLDDLGLLAALRNHIQEFGQKFGLQINFAYEGDKSRLPAVMETALYRITQEALTNAAKYAGTDRVDVLLTQSPQEVRLSVKDYGGGFDPANPARRGVGLYSMEERAEGLNGKLHLDSAPGRGTVIDVTLPLETGRDGA